MKKFLFFLSILATIFSCGSDPQGKIPEKSDKKEADKKADDASFFYDRCIELQDKYLEDADCKKLVGVKPDDDFAACMDDSDDEWTFFGCLNDMETTDADDDTYSKSSNTSNTDVLETVSSISADYGSSTNPGSSSAKKEFVFEVKGKRLSDTSKDCSFYSKPMVWIVNEADTEVATATVEKISDTKYKIITDFPANAYIKLNAEVASAKYLFEYQNNSLPIDCYSYIDDQIVEVIHDNKKMGSNGILSPAKYYAPFIGNNEYKVVKIKE